METRTKETHQVTDLLPQGVKQPVPFENVTADEVELTDDELETIIRKAKFEKAARMRSQAYHEKLCQPIIYPKITAVDLGILIMRYAKQIMPERKDEHGNIVDPGFILDDQNKHIFKLLCQYFTQDPEFEKTGYSLKKGLYLFGNIGCGKTTLMKLFMRNPTNDYSFKSCREVADEYTKTKEGGPFTLEKYSNLLDVYAHEHYGQAQIGYCFDDLGTEKLKRHFGNELNVMEDIFLNRYDNGLIGKTHLTTNLTTDEIEEVYGARVRSRLREMCNLIAFDPEAEDRRK